MIHNLPEIPAFCDEPSDSPISELALRVVVEFQGWDLYVVGTATLVAGHLAITAKHVLDYVVRQFGAQQKSEKYSEIDSYALRLYQVLPGLVYRVWNVYSAWTCPTDIAILHLGLWRTSLPEETIQWKQPILRALPPPIGQKVIAFGYREGKVSVKADTDGTHHIEMHDKPTISIGEIKQIYPSGRDSVMLPFPCYEVEARFDAGMSGGMIVDENGALCGLVCASLSSSDPNVRPTSYIATLWPMLATSISANRGDRYPRNVEYPMIDLARDGLMTVVDLEKLQFPPFNHDTAT